MCIPTLSFILPVHEHLWDNKHFFWISLSNDEFSLSLGDSLDTHPKRMFSVLHGETQFCMLSNQRWLMNCTEKGNPAMVELAIKIDQALGQGYMVFPIINKQCDAINESNSLSKTYKFTFKTSFHPIEIPNDEEKFNQLVESIQQSLAFRTLLVMNPELGQCSLTITPL